MINYVSIFFLTALLFGLVDVMTAQKKTNKTEVIEISSGINGSMLERVESNMHHMMRWMKHHHHHRDFVGRCLGAVRRLKSVLFFIVFALGVILTTLKFLTIFVLKGLAIGLTLLIINVSGLFTKFAVLQSSHKYPQKEQPIHVHVHGKNAQSPTYTSSSSHYHTGPDYEETYYSDWDRSMNPPSLSNFNSKRRKASPLLNRPLTALEKLELMRLYERLGLTQKINDVT
ncbi:uncharacterized protein LOC108736461 [Agrilus planipennis]|uniref:Uncharacterized protein LOC108736461 n=1 Tax=Agrilus planipennis TaxID=224129 RepID=A0A1W4WW90_AGRPL|nr:uncharacterized protein LOC108736461 [Agrilus planipennis]